MTKRKKTPQHDSARASKPKAPRPSGRQPAERGESFPIVAIGASGGGLEALDQFFRHVPEGSGMAFVVMQHLAPAHEGNMVELRSSERTRMARSPSTWTR